MSFAYPWLLLLIPPSLLIAFWKRKYASINVPSKRLWNGGSSLRIKFSWLPFALKGLAICGVVVAIAKPQGMSYYSQDIKRGIAIQLLVDVSSSMGMTITGDSSGKKRTRMDVAKTIVEQFVAGDDDTLMGRPDDLIGLITFARYADTRSPLTFGHDALLQIIRGVDIQERPNEDGTAYGDALALAAARLKNLEELQQNARQEDLKNIKSRVIILLTDGENNSGNHLPTEAAGLAKAWDCRVYAISLGDPPIDIAKESDNQLNSAEQVLEHISNETGGIFRQAHDVESLRSVYREINELEQTDIATRSSQRVVQLAWIPTTIALFALTLALILESTWLRTIP
ncbi:MAG: VWA domain-containing protein [Verrucomicrobiota bacterium]